MSLRPDGARRLAAALAVLLALAGPAHANDQAMERARAAQARGDLRGAVLEYRNAIRLSPDLAAARAGLAQASLDLGDAEGAEAAARAALDRGFDRAAGTALVLRAILLRGRFEDLLRDTPLREGVDPPGVAAQIAAARAQAQLVLGQREEARQSAAAATRLAPGAVEAQLAAAAVAMIDNDRAGAEAAVGRALAIDPDNAEALLRRSTLQFAEPNIQAGLATLDRAITRWPASQPLRQRRAEILLQLNETARAKQDIDILLTQVPNSTVGIYLRAQLLIRTEDWRGADEQLQRLGALLVNFPDGLLLQAAAKRSLGQSAQALEAVQRFIARQPDDPRGARLLALIELDAGRTGEAAAVLGRFATRGIPMDAEMLDLYGRTLALTGRAREAAEVFGRAAAAAPRDAGIQARLALARFSLGDTAGLQTAADAALTIDANQPGVRELLATAALARGDARAATAEFEKLGPEARRSEIGQGLDASLRLARLDVTGARAGFEAMLRSFPESQVARLGLARIASVEGRAEDNERLLAEVIQREPGNPEALVRLGVQAAQAGPRGAAARQILDRAITAQPGQLPLIVTLAGALLRGNDIPRAIALLESDPVKPLLRDPRLQLLLSETYAAAARWPQAEAAARAALAEAADNAAARRQLAALLLRSGATGQAETLVREGLRAQPGNAVLQQFLVSMVQQTRGVDPALAAADEVARMPGAQPAAATLRGEVLARANRPADAARAFAIAYGQAPSLALALRLSEAQAAANRPADAVAALEAWLQRTPGDPVALGALAQLDIAAGRKAEAERRLEAVLQREPQDAVALNNLAWLLGERGDPRARELAERAYLLLPNAATADTLGWILARAGETRQALLLLRSAAAATGTQAALGRGIAYRLAFALQAAGDRAEAQRVLAPALADPAPFPERAEAERLLASLQTAR